jgi:hypothetical protein
MICGKVINDSMMKNTSIIEKLIDHVIFIQYPAAISITAKSVIGSAFL